jgi:hypothetical protein
VLTWEELERAAPEISSRGRELIEKFQFVLVGTLTKDGSPRVTPVEAYILDGHLVSNMIPRSLKALDLLRDKLAGRADVLEDKTLRRKLDDLFWEMIGWRPAPDSHYFEFRAERAAWVTHDGEGQTQLVWKPGADGEKRLYKPGI